MALPVHYRCSKLARCNRECSNAVPPITYCALKIGRVRTVIASQRNVAASSSSTSTAVAPPAIEARVASVQVTLDNSIEQITVPLTDPYSRLVEAKMLFPLGLVIENVNGEPVITEVAKGGAAEEAGCRVGDVVRAATAMTMQMTYPTMNIMFGGVGRPKLVKMLLPTNKVPFPKVLDAVRSNTVGEGGDGSITLVLERAGAGNSAQTAQGAAGGSGSESQENRELATVGVGNGVVSASEESPVFDPAIFE